MPPEREIQILMVFFYYLISEFEKIPRVISSSTAACPPSGHVTCMHLLKAELFWLGHSLAKFLQPCQTLIMYFFSTGVKVYHLSKIIKLSFLAYFKTSWIQPLPV